MIKTSYTVSPISNSERLDIYISAESGLSRSYIKRLIKQELLLVNSNPEKAGYKVKSGDIIELTIPDEPEWVLTPENIPLDIIWQDGHILVVNKPPHMVIYPAAGNKSGTLMNAVVSTCRKLSLLGGPLRPGVVHRLDKDTSGAIVIAKDDQAYYSLTSQFKKREIEKQYLALLYGNLKTDRGEIKAAIGRALSDRKKMSTRTRRGKEAVTRFEVIERFDSAALVNIKIITGRTHQIRVHFASIGHPVLGDKIYGKKTVLKLRHHSVRFSRQMLHACSLKLRHPVQGEAMEFKAPMPEDMEKAMEELRESSSKS